VSFSRESVCVKLISFLPSLAKSTTTTQHSLLMRLINNRQLGFENFIGSKIPSYAILSHTWEEEEISFQDFISQIIVSQKRVGRKKGYEKILKCCQLALRDGYEYTWIDTCNIDKASSAELTEAINSMFNWYARSSRCYVYLSDFDSKDPTADFSRCRWFTRGWTLQARTLRRSHPRFRGVVAY
jgi:hypothetical protein